MRETRRPTPRQQRPEGKRKRPVSLPARGALHQGYRTPKTIQYYHIPRERPRPRASDVACCLIGVALVLAMFWALGQCRSLGYADGHAAGYREGYAAAQAVSAP